MSGIQSRHASRLRAQLAQLDISTVPEEMDFSGWDLHALKGTLKNYWAVRVDKNWRMIFTFEDGDAVLVDYRDYH